MSDQIDGYWFVQKLRARKGKVLLDAESVFTITDPHGNVVAALLLRLPHSYEACARTIFELTELVKDELSRESGPVQIRPPEVYT